MREKALKWFKGIKLPAIGFHPLFVGYLTYLFVSGSATEAAITVFVILLHEAGHFFASIIEGKEVKEILFYPFGAVIEEDEYGVCSGEWKIAIAGPLVNLLICIICAIAISFGVKGDLFSQFLNANITVFVFNLLPVYPLDGARAILGASKKPISLMKRLRVFGIITGFVLVLLFVLSSFYSINYSFLIMGLFLMIGARRGMEREMSTRIATTLLHFSKPYEKGVPVSELAFDGETPIYKVLEKINRYKLTDIVVISDGKRSGSIKEESFLEIASKSPATEKIKNLI